MLPNLNSIIEKLSHTFRIEQRIESNDEELSLITESFLGSKLLYSHKMDMLPLLEEMKKRL